MKRTRHTAIRDLVQHAPIASQAELRRKLAARGFHVTQATLSRDIRDLHLFKGPRGYQFASSGADDHSLPGLRQILKGFGLEARQALNQIVLLTSTGSAQPVAAGIDEEAWPEVVGTIAGDNTVLIICPDDRQAKALKTRIEAYLA